MKAVRLTFALTVDRERTDVHALEAQLVAAWRRQAPELLRALGARIEAVALKRLERGDQVDAVAA